MSNETHIVAAIYREKPALRFEDIVDEFELSLRANSSGRRSLTFDHDDIVIVEIEQLRVGLAWVAPEAPQDPYSLVIATGIDPDHPDGVGAGEFCARLSEQILARTYAEIPYDTVFRASFDEDLDTEFLDQIASGLQALVSFEMPVETNSYQTSAAELADQSGMQTVVADIHEGAAPQRPDAGFNRLRAAYQDAVRDDQAQTSVIWQAMMAGANTMIETVTNGADFVRQVSPATDDDDPYNRLKKIPMHRPRARYFDRFDKAEYELYGSLLD